MADGQNYSISVVERMRDNVRFSYVDRIILRVNAMVRVRAYDDVAALVYSRAHRYTVDVYHHVIDRINK